MIPGKLFDTFARKMVQIKYVCNKILLLFFKNSFKVKNNPSKINLFLNWNEVKKAA